MQFLIVVQTGEDFNPEKETDIPKSGKLIQNYSSILDRAEFARKFNALQIKTKEKPHYWAILYIADKEPVFGDILEFKPLKNVLRLQERDCSK